jgi:predicted ester cyclase
MAAFPDIEVLMDDVVIEGDRAVYHWTLAGTNSGPGGTGKRVRIRGFEVWTIDVDGLISESQGHFDNSAYQRQLKYGLDES